MRKVFSAIIAVTGLMSLTVSNIGLGQDKTLHFFNWSEYMDPNIIKGFEQKYSVKVQQSFYESDDDMLAKVEQDGTQLYDLVVPSTAIATVMRRKNLLMRLDQSLIPNLKNLSSRFRTLESDPGNRYAVPYQWGSMGIAYRKDLLPNPDRTWGLFFDPKKQPGPFVMLEVPHETIGAALKYLGRSLNSRNKEDLKLVLPLLEGAAKRSLGFNGASAIGTKLQGKQAVIGMNYSGNILRVIEENKNIGFFIPKEGSELFVDTIAIPSGAPNAALAHQFINYLLEANVGAQLSNYNRYGTPNEAALPLINAADRKNPILYPGPNEMKKLELIGDLGEAQTYYDSVWTKIKSR